MANKMVETNAALASAARNSQYAGLTVGDAEVNEGSDGLTKLRYLASVVVAGLALGFALSTQLNAIVSGVGVPLGVIAALLLGFPIALIMRRRGWRTVFHAMAAGAFLGFVPWGLSGALTSFEEMLGPVIVGVSVAITAWLALKLQTLPLRFVPSQATTIATVVFAALAISLGIGGVQGASLLIYGAPASPESRVTVAAFEVPLPSAPERRELLDLLRRQAKAEGLHVDAASDEELAHMAKAMPDTVATIDAAIYRGTKDNLFEASVSDRFHPSLVWITFSRGEDVHLAKQFRDRAMKAIAARWPHTRTLPLTPGGSIPLPDDMILTGNRYLVKASVAANYELSSNSPLVARGVQQEIPIAER